MQQMERFGEKLHALRLHNNLTLAQLAEQLGYTTHSYISELEANRKSPTVKFVLKAARLFDVTTDELLKDELEVDLLVNSGNE
ncbi:MAG: helix-turn-helix transcriptional regulator [Chloroflexota bacterium]